MPNCSKLGCQLWPIAAALTLLTISGCATTIPAAPKDERAASDPWEPFNRRVTALNDNIDRFTFKPIAKGYQKVVPSFVRRGIDNFYGNLSTPLYIINNLLQGKLQRGVSETGRLLVNSTIGLGGLIDVSSGLGMETYREDFGQTFAVWGVSDGPFVVVPLMGPRTLRDAFAIPFDSAADPMFWIDHDQTRWAFKLGDLINTRVSLFAAESLIEDSYDRYLAIRESYLQNREFLIYDGDPPEDEDFYDDFEDPEDFDDPEEE